MRAFSLAVMICCLLAASAPVHAITIGQVDDFQSGSSQDWLGAVTGYPADSGPGGVGDTAMFADAQPPPNRPRLVAYDIGSRWMGDYSAAGVDKIAMHVRNPNDFDLTMWVGIAGPAAPVGPGGTGDTYVSNIGIPVAADNQWHCISFDVSAGDFANVNGADIVAALADVRQIRILHHPVQSFLGARVDAEFFLDNVRAISEPLPGDTDYDDDVDFSDFNSLANNFTGTDGSGKDWCDGDFDGDGDVDFTDFNDLANNFTGTGGGGKAVAPEPSSFLLAAIATVTLLTIGWWRRLGAQGPVSPKA